jgi:hypothetical protein
MPRGAAQRCLCDDCVLWLLVSSPRLPGVPSRRTVLSVARGSRDSTGNQITAANSDGRGTVRAGEQRTGKPAARG